MGIFSSMTGFGGRDMAVDLGTANTLVYVRGRGIVLSEPSVVAIDQRSGEVHAVGVEAKRMLGRTPGTIQAIRPLKDGVIADFDVTEQMLRHFIQKVHQHRFAHPRVVVCVPSGVTGVEKRAVEEATLSAGARQAYLIEEPMAAAIGAGLPVAEPTGNMIVDIGGGTTEVAVISLGGIVVSQSLRVGGDEMDEAIINHIKRDYKLLIGQQTAEEIKLEIGSAWDMKEELQAEVRGRDMLTGLPKTVILTSEEIRRALDEPVDADHRGDQVDARQDAAGARRRHHGPRHRARRRRRAPDGLDERLRHETQMPVHLAESPLTCVAVGSGRSLEEFEAIHRSNRARARGRATAAATRPVRHPARPRPAGAAVPCGRGIPRPHRARGGAGLVCPALQVQTASPRRGAEPLVRRIVLAVLVVGCARAPDDLVPLADVAASLHDVQGYGSAALRPFQVAAERVARPFRDVYGYFSGLAHAKSENERLRRELRDARASANANLASARRAESLKRLLQFEGGATYPEGLPRGEHDRHLVSEQRVRAAGRRSPPARTRASTSTRPSSPPTG